MATRLPPLLDRAILFAHRGARANEREHTLEAFELALRLGATGIQVDAWATRDGVVVLDRSGLVRRFPKRRIADVDHAEVASSMVTIDDLFDTVHDVPLRVGAADHTSAMAVVAAAERRGIVDRVWLVHPDLDVLAEWRDAAPLVRLVNLASVEALPMGPERRAAELAAARVDAVALPEGDWSGGLVTLFHRFDVLAFADDAHYERQLVRLIDMGIDGVSGDHVDRMVAVAATFE
ncbi:MAG: glycerophosphodiester phosphodiesterase [Acidimicrobiales bacterium]